MSKVIKSFSVRIESPVLIEHDEIAVTTETDDSVENPDENCGEELVDPQQVEAQELMLEQDAEPEPEVVEEVPDIEQIKEQASEILQETEVMVKELIETARQEAEKIIKSANEEASRIITSGRENLKTLEEEFKQQGWQDGYENGLGAAENEYSVRLEEANNIIEKARKERQNLIAGSEDEIVQLAVAVARKVISQELTINPDIIIEIVKRAIQKVTDREELTVRVNPDNLDNTLNAQDEIAESVKGVRKLKIMSDPTVSPGGCVVESANGTVDARIERQLNEIEKALMEVGPNA